MTYSPLSTVVQGEPVAVEWGNQVKDNFDVLPRGVLGYEETTTPHTGISSIEVLTGLTVVVNVAANRLIRITGHIHVTQRTSSATVIAQIRHSGGQLNRFGLALLTANENELFEGSVVIAPGSAGQKTYWLALETAAGTVEAQTAATRPNFILVEDIGAA